MIKMVHVPKEETEHFVYYERRSSPPSLPIRGRGSEGMDLEEKRASEPYVLPVYCLQCLLSESAFLPTLM
jgi:hypothetical protein